jgi:hypothetical protein
MKFTVHGVIEDEVASITWKDGFVTGDKGALAELFALASVLDGKPVGPEPEGPFTTQDHLSSPLSALVLIEDVLDEVTGVEGQAPGPLCLHEVPHAA